ncbi:hypothetical protein CRYUN_Cryun25bG0080500 [Craigia yunnanensis]
MMAQLQPTLVTTFCLYRSAGIVSRPIVPLKIKGKAAGFASCTNSSSRSAASSFQAHSIANTTHHQDQIVRPLGNFSPNMWGDRFLLLPFSNSEFESCSRQVEVLKEMVKDMFVTSTDDPIENMYLITSLYRLGVSYHFESEIEEKLSHLFTTLPQFMDNTDYDLHTVGVIFQVFRSYGYKMPCDVFNKFNNGDGMFKEELTSNIKGMINLYEASHWGMHGELILDEALAFTTLHLESLVSQSCPDHLREYIANALNRPYHKGMPRLEARQYISFYEKYHESRNDILLKFAKYDFNRVQMHLQQELSLLSRYDISAMDELPGDYLKSLYETVLNISDEVEEDVSKEERSFCVSCIKESVKKQVLAYHVQVRWRHECIMPAFDEFLENEIWSIGAILSLALLMVEMEEADENEYQWLINCDDKILRATSVLNRLYNDIQSYEDEEKRGIPLSGIACYMKEYGVSKKEAIEGLQERIRFGWKDLNEGFLVRPTPVARQILMGAFNIARVSDVC